MNNCTQNTLLKKGDPSAYEDLFKQTYPRMLGYCQLFISNKQQANDLVQDCYVKLWEKRSNIKISQSVESLLFVMLRNHCFNFLRDKKLQITKQEISKIEKKELQHLYQLDFLGKEEKILEEKLINALQTSIEHLPEKRKKIFIKTKIEGKKNKEVAKDFNISIKAVEKHIHKAKEQIKQEMLKKYPLLSMFIVFIIR